MFVALDLPAGPRAALAAWRDELLEGRRDLRPVRDQALHVTLVFLGWQDEAAAEAIAGAAIGACGGLAAPRLGAGAVRPLPPRNPRLFALDLADEDGRATAIQAAVSDALEEGRWYRPEKRPFWPHVTLARFRKQTLRRAALPLLDTLTRNRIGDVVRHDRIAEIQIVASELTPSGPRYDVKARAALR